MGNKYNEFFDSFGIEPSNRVVNMLKSNGKDVAYNSHQIQNIEDVTCGLWCVYYIFSRSMGISQYDITHRFSMTDFKANERLLRQLIKRFL